LEKSKGDSSWRRLKSDGTSREESISSRAMSEVDWIPWILSLNSLRFVARFRASSSVIRPDL